MGGWSFAYDFTLLAQKLRLSQWNEIEFGRKEDFYLDENARPVGDGKSWGYQGVLALWYLPIQTLTLGLQYRYAHHKLGHIEYQDAWIYTVKYNF